MSETETTELIAFPSEAVWIRQPPYSGVKAADFLQEFIKTMPDDES